MMVATPLTHWSEPMPKNLLHTAYDSTHTSGWSCLNKGL